MMNYAIQKAWARLARLLVAKALQDVRTATKAIAFATVEKARLEAAYNSAVRTTPSVRAKAEAAVAAEKAGKARRRKIVRLATEAKAAVARAKAAEVTAFSAANAIHLHQMEWDRRNAVRALREVEERLFWAKVDAYGLPEIVLIQGE